MDDQKTQGQASIDDLRAILLHKDREVVDRLGAQLAEQERLLEGYALKLEHSDAELLRLSSRVGDDEQLRKTLVPVLSQSIADIEKANPRPLARAMSPFIVTSIRSEIANSKEAMVEALYPITGRLVSASVKNSVAAMMETINQRVNEATSTRMLHARFKSWRSGNPVSSYLVPRPGEVILHRTMLLERDTGTPICTVDLQGDASEKDEHSNLASALLAALSNLTEEVFSGENDELRTLDLNGRKITFRRSFRHLLVVEFIGVLSADQHRIIDEHFGELVSLSEENNQEGLSDELAQLLQAVENPSGKQEKEKNYVGTVLITLLVALLTWYALSAWQQRQLQNAADTLGLKIRQSSTLGAYPIEVLGNPEERSLRVTGLIPESHDPLALRVQWQEWTGDFPVEVVLEPIADAKRTKELEEELDLLRAENRALILREKLRDEVAAPSLRSYLATLIKDKVFLIDPDGGLIDSDGSSALLRRVARLLIAGNIHLQVIGLVSGDAMSNAHSARMLEILKGLGVAEEQLEVAAQLDDAASEGLGTVVFKIREYSP